MQSFLQYRRFKKHATRQFEDAKGRDLPTAHSNKPIDPRLEALSDPTSTSERSSPSRDPEKYEDTRDLEKGESADEALDDDRPAAVDDLPHSLMRRATTRNSFGTALGNTLTGIDVRDRTTHEGQSGKVFVVGYHGDEDSLNPHNWSTFVRIRATMLIASIGFVVGFASSVDSAALPQAAKEFGVSEVTESLATGLFLIGFGCGSLFAGPISETIGRNPVYIATLTLYMIFIMAAGLSPNIGAQLAFRFIAGCFAATPLVCAGGSISDLWRPLERVFAFPVFANAAFMGPVIGPVVGGFIGQSHLISWRWTEWITLIMSGLVLGLVLLFQPETYAPTLLKWKAQHLRAISGDDRYRAPMEIRESSFLHRLGTALYRPFLLTFSEPIIMLFALYLTVIYIILFTFLNGFTFIFTDTYGFSQGLTGLSFLGIAIGLCGASALVPLIYRWAKHDLEKVQEQGGTRLPPEFRLWYGIFGAPAIPISLFWMGWTAYPSISCWSPLAATVLFGHGILCVFICCYQYIIDSYESWAASALASMTLIRYAAAGGMIEVAIPMYKNLGVHWALTVLGCISALMVPVPVAFMIWGPKIRGWSKYAVA